MPAMFAVRNRRAAPLIALVVTGVVGTALAGCASPAATNQVKATEAAEATDSAAYVKRVRPVVVRLGTSASTLSGRLLATSSKRDLPRLHAAALSQLANVNEVAAALPDLEAPESQTRSQRALVLAVQSHRDYLSALARATNGTRGLAQLGTVRARAARSVRRYRTFFALAPRGLPDGITSAGLDRLDGLHAALKDAAIPPPVRTTTVTTAVVVPTPPPAAAAPARGSLVDYVANSGGEGVRYRFSPTLGHLVPGNGPFEGNAVTVSCFTTGETVRGNPWWARLANGYYVPTTYLRYSSSGIPGDAAYC